MSSIAVWTAARLFFLFDWALAISVIRSRTESALPGGPAYLGCVIILLTLIAADNQAVSMKHFHIMKHPL